MNAPTISLQEINQLPIIRFEGKILIIDTLPAFQKAINDINTRGGTWGFDTETRPSFKKGRTYNVSLIQLANDDICYLFRLNRLGLRTELVDILTNPSILKIGLSLRDDLRGLNKMRSFQAQGFIDLQEYVQQFGIQEKSLKKICAIVLKARISKNQQTSNWDAPVLNESQQIYAATDAWVCLKIYQKLRTTSPNHT
ncbi:MAG: 3'-5' exonuclease [Bacteroidales bacterium]